MDEMLTDVEQHVLDLGFKFISFRPRSRKEIEQFLSKKIAKIDEPKPNLLDDIIGRLARYGHVNDEAFVTWWVVQRNAHRPKGARVLEQELLQKGVSREVIRSVLDSQKAQLKHGDSEIVLARKALKNRFERWKILPTLDQKKKLYSFLLRRGFSNKTIRQLVDELLTKDYNTMDEAGTV